MSRLVVVPCVLAALVTASSLARQTALSGHTAEVTFVAFLPDGGALLSGSLDHTIRVWDVTSAKERSVWQRVGEFDTAPSTSVIALSGDSTLMVRGGPAQGTVEIWDVARSARVKTFRATRGPIKFVAMSRNGALLAAADDDEAVAVDSAAGRVLARLSAPRLNVITAIAAAPDGVSFATASSDKVIGVYQAAGGRPLARFENVPGRVRALAFSPDGRLVASGQDGASDTSVRIWDAVKPDAVQQVLGPPNYASAVAFSPDGQRLAVAGAVVKVWDVPARRVTHSFEGHRGAVRSLAFSPDGQSLASASEDSLIGLWTLKPGGTP